MAVNRRPHRDVYAPSQARCQAKAAFARGRRGTKKAGLPAGEIPGQLSIDDVLADIAAERSERAVEGGEQG